MARPQRKKSIRTASASSRKCWKKNARANFTGSKLKPASKKTACWMDKTPVTNEQYQHFLKANPKHPAPNVKQDWAKPYNWNGRDFPKGAEKHPVVLVSWNDAQAFCKWAGKVLPTDLQWEKSARGIDGRRWPWGSTWNRDNCNSASWWAKKDLFEEKEWREWWDNVFGKELSGKKIMTTPVGQFGIEPPYGCVDSAGNVWEWCEDFYDEQKFRQVLRGGAWYLRLHYVACSIRNGDEPDVRNSSIGFRCARTPFAQRAKSIALGALGQTYFPRIWWLTGCQSVEQWVFIALVRCSV